MKRFYLLRSNIRYLEYYHKFQDLKTFENNCHDFYLLLPLQLLKEKYFDEVIIWRLENKKKKHHPDIVFNIGKRKFIQRWVHDFKEIYKYSNADITFFRGGFKEYDNTIKLNKKHFGLTLYLGASKRIIPFPQFKKYYDIVLMESNRDMQLIKTMEKNSNIPFIKNIIPFFKTANPNIFKPLNIQQKKYDICWPCNFTQINYKGQDFFMRMLSINKQFQSLKIIHCGNKKEVGENLAKKYNLKNIEFKGWVNKEQLNNILNQSKFGLVTSNKTDGCPRISTEIQMSGTPLIIRNETRLMEYYKQKGTVSFQDNEIFSKIKYAFENYSNLQKEILECRNQELKFEKICQKNITQWLKFLQ
jgi:glycosyltransferase involved in cell wall biosynthesis